MIDLEAALSALVERAPAPPALGSVARRARQRRWRRRTLALVIAVAVLGGGIAGAITVGSSPSTPPVSGVTPAVARVRVTMLDGSQLQISGPASLGLTKLTPGFNGALGPVSGPQWGTLGHGFSVDRHPPSHLGTVVGHYPTHDGHDLVVYRTEAVVQYGDWWLSVNWSENATTKWAAFASELNAKESADGYLVVEPTGPSWKLGPADAPDIQLGGDPYGSGASFGFFGPETFPAGCPAATEKARTAQGWPVSMENGAWWCDPNAKVRVAVWDQKLVDASLRGLRVAYTPATRAVDRVTTLDGSSFEITAPASVLDQLFLQSAVYVDGLSTPNILNETPNILPVEATRGALPAGAGEPSFPTADGHRFFSYHLRAECECDMLAATYGEWLVEIQVERSGGAHTMSLANRTRLASLFGAHETVAGFLVLDPAAPMHVGAGQPGADIVLDSVDMYTSQYNGCSPPNRVDTHTPQGYGVHLAGGGASWCDPVARVNVDILNSTKLALISELRVRRIP